MSSSWRRYPAGSSDRNFLCLFICFILYLFPLLKLYVNTLSPVWEIHVAVHLAVACDVFIGVSLCCPFSHEMSWMGSGVSEGFPTYF